MHANNAIGAERLQMGQHGFVWLFTKAANTFHHGETLHIFTHVDLRRDATRIKYQGMYAAHIVNVFLPATAWCELSTEVTFLS